MRGEITTVSPPLAQIYRIARRGGDPFAPPPWEMAGEDGTFGNRFDDPGADRGYIPSQRFRILYCASTAIGAFGETLARFRPSIALLARLRAIEDEEPLEVQLLGTRHPFDSRTAFIPADWRLRRLLAPTVLDADLRFADLAALPTHQYLRQVMAADLAELALPDLDFSTVSGPRRVLTQRCARHIYDLRNDAGAGLFAGVRYLSRLNPDWECWAIFADRMVHTPGFAATISPDNPDLLAVCRLFNLDVETL
jgi:hypothetical protein